MGKSRNKNYNLIVREKGLGELKKIQQGLDKTNNSLKKVQRTSKATSKSLGQMRSSFAGFIAVMSVREIARFSDEVQLLEDRLSVFANEGEAGKDVLEQLNVVANTTRASVTNLGEAYNRISINTKDLGLNTQQLLKVTQALQQTFRLSGASSAEANSSLIQLTQGMAQGELRGQELRSVLEANSIFGGLLAEKMGVARGALIKLGEDGALKTSVILEVLNDNFDDLNSKAEKLRPTFEQGAIKGLNELRLGLNDLNREYNISGGFFNTIEFAIGNVNLLSSALIALSGPAVFGAVVSAVTKLSGSMTVMAGPIGLIAAGLAALNFAAGKWIDTQKELGTQHGVETRIAELNDQLRVLRESFKPGHFEGFGQTLSKEEETAFRATDAYKKLSKQMGSLKLTLAGFRAELNEPKKSSTSLDVAEEVKGLQLLNQQYTAGLITLQQYKDANYGIVLGELNDKFKAGKIDVEDYNEQLKKAKTEMDSLRDAQFSLSKSLSDGGKEYLKSIGTLSEQISGATNNAFDTMENQLYDFVKTGKLRFKDFAQSVMDDLLRIAIRQQVVGPLARALGSAFSSGNTSTSYTTTSTGAGFASTAANGNAYGGGSLIPFATGGVVGSPTTFGMSGGRTGLMGEAGPEGILPLDRVNGKLGVNASGLGSNVTVNIINNSDSGVETQEREGPDGERIIEIMIDKKVRESFASGKMDQTMKSNFGIRRVGV